MFNLNRANRIRNSHFRFERVSLRFVNKAKFAVGFATKSDRDEFNSDRSDLFFFNARILAAQIAKSQSERLRIAVKLQRFEIAERCGKSQPNHL